jgi:prephenate dehydrogenase
MKIAVVGLGLIGGSIAKDIRETGFANDIIGVDANKEHLKEALRIGIANTSDCIEEAVKKADLTILAIPVDQIIRILPGILDIVNDNATVIDLGSTKKEICNTVERHPKRGNYVPSHPMSGTENSGPSAAVTGLFKGKMAIICDRNKSNPSCISLVEKMYRTIGMHLIYMSAEEHDYNTAFVSHLPHAVSFALANAVLAKQNKDIIFDLASGGFNSTARLAKSVPSMWGPIFQQNREYIVEALEVYIKYTKKLTKALKKKADNKVLELMYHANKIRDVLDRQIQYKEKEQ